MKKLDGDLSKLISWSVALLGDAIKDEYGQGFFNEVEVLRKRMTSLRGQDSQSVYRTLLKEQEKIEGYSTDKLKKLALSYSLMLELINRCETAFRTYKLHGKKPICFEKKPYAIIFVTTAHPTEARSPEVLSLFDKIQDLLTSCLVERKKADLQGEIFHYIRLALKLQMSRSSKPQIEDEAQNIYNYILREDIIEALISHHEKGMNVFLRTWVGGDKDGHPYVNEKEMLKSLTISRRKIVSFFLTKLSNVKEDVSILGEKSEKIDLLLKEIEKTLKALRNIKDNDGKLVLSLKKDFQRFADVYEKAVGIKNPKVEKLRRLFWLFPALVLPLEVREDSELVHEALKPGVESTIKNMLKKLKQIANGNKCKWYVRGFVLSMVQDSSDFLAGKKLTQKVLGKNTIPVVPLLENEVALVNAIPILKESFKADPTIVKQHQDNWGGRFEVMLGYSDSSKENGVLPSRVLIGSALDSLDTFISSQKLIPVFFHGSGGSIARGGGSIKEQTEWWPESALNIFKVTIQGEMVARNFANGTIFNRQIEQIAGQFELIEPKAVGKKEIKTLKKLSEKVKEEYKGFVGQEDFFDFLEASTPYNFLHLLKIGSRPTKRGTGPSSRKLRAIPWILCWTQTRLLLPNWWGIGTAWKRLEDSDKKEFKKLYNSSNLLFSYLKVLGFTLAKVEIGVWKLYLEKSDLSDELKEKYYDLISLEFKLAVEFFREITGEDSFLWFRKWLEESIKYRTPLIHPINLIQIEALKRRDAELMRECVTGVACGMLTTG